MYSRLSVLFKYHLALFIFPKWNSFYSSWEEISFLTWSPDELRLTKRTFTYSSILSFNSILVQGQIISDTLLFYRLLTARLLGAREAIPVVLTGKLYVRIILTTSIYVCVCMSVFWFLYIFIFCKYISYMFISSIHICVCICDLWSHQNSVMNHYIDEMIHFFSKSLNNSVNRHIDMHFSCQLCSQLMSYMQMWFAIFSNCKCVCNETACVNEKCKMRSMF